MKRYLVFMGECYYPSGGMSDFVSDHDTEEEAKKALDIVRGEDYKWGHVYDQEEKCYIEKI